MGALKYWLSQRFYVSALGLYLLLFFIIGCLKSIGLPSMPIIGVQLLYLILVILFSSLTSLGSVRQTVFSIIVFQLICCVGLRLFNTVYYGNPLGYEPVDALEYDEMGKYCHMPYIEFIAMHFAYSDSFEVDDIGFPSIIYIVYRLFDNWGREVLVILNVFIVTWSSFVLFRTASFFLNKRDSLFLCFFWGIEAFSIYTASVGLKENFFLFFIISALYCLCKMQHNKSYLNILLFLLVATMTLFFRIALFYSLIVIFVSVFLLRSEFVRKNMWLISFLIALFVLINFVSIVGGIAEQRGYEYSNIAHNYEENSGGLLGWITNLTAALIGPIPSFVSDEFKRNYVTLYSFTPFCKMLYSLFFLYGMFYALRNKITEYFPFILMWVMNTIMIVFTFYTLHDRYQWPHIPCTLILSALGFRLLKNATYFKPFIGFYTILVCFLIILFNLR